MSAWVAWLIGALATGILVWVAGSSRGRIESAARLLALAAFVQTVGALIEWAKPDLADEQFATAVLIGSLVLTGVATLVLVRPDDSTDAAESLAAVMVIAAASGLAGYFHLDLVPGVPGAQGMSVSPWEVALACGSIGFLVGASLMFVLDTERETALPSLYDLHLLGLLVLAAMCPWAVACDPLARAAVVLLGAIAFLLPGGLGRVRTETRPSASSRVAITVTALAGVAAGTGVVAAAVTLEDDRPAALTGAIVVLVIGVGLLGLSLRGWRSRSTWDMHVERLRVGDDVAVIELDADGAVVRATEQLWTMTDRRDEEPFTLLAAIHPEDEQGMAASMLRSLEENREIRRRARLAAGGRVRWIDFRIVPRVVAGEPNGLVISLSDVTEEERRRAQTAERIRVLEHLADHDGLTGLANRNHLLRHLEQVAAETGDGNEVTVLFVDIDDFKAVNDRLGHEAGDAVLAELSQRLRLAARSEDLVARLGGDEFVVVAQNIGGEDGDALANRILDEIQRPFRLGDELVPVTVSVGLARTTGPIGDPAELLRLADRAMFEAKSEGKNRISGVGGRADPESASP